ncbi:T9SS type A sorting domain-containing protein [Lacinutrix undariae]
MKINLHIFLVAILFTIPSIALNSLDNTANLNTASKLYTPTIPTLTGFTYIFDSGISANQTFILTDTSAGTKYYLVDAVTNYEVSTMPTSGFNDQLTIAPLDFIAGEITVYVRLKSNLEIGTYNSQINLYYSNTPDNYISIGEGSQIIIQGEVTPKTSTWDGTTWLNGTPDINTSITLTADYDTALGSIEAYNIQVNAEKTLSIANSTYVKIKNDAVVNGTLSVSTNGAFIQVNDNGTFTLNEENGYAVVNKLTTPLNKWYDYTYWSSPVVNTTTADAFTSSNPGMRYWYNPENFLDILDGATAGHDDIDDNGDDWLLLSEEMVLQPGHGYAATHSGGSNFTSGTAYPYNFEGAFNTGTITVPIHYNGDNGDADWNFIGNPYPCAISVDAFLAENPTIIGSAIYLWSHASPPLAANSGNETYNFNTNDYAIITGASGEVAGGSTVIPNRYIPSGQGFFVQGMANGTVTFTNAMRVADNSSNNQFFRADNTQTDNKLWLDLKSDSGVFNQVLVAYVDGATNSNDGCDYDAMRNLSSGAPAIIYTTIQGNTNKKYAIEGKSPESLTINESIDLGFYTSESNTTQYTFSIAKKQGDFLSNHSIFIKDNLLGMYHDITNSDYEFTSETGEFNSRFEVVFTQETLNISTNEFENALTVSEINTSEIQFKMSNNTNINSVSLYNILGQLVSTETADTTTSTINTTLLAKGTYIAKVELANQVIVTKKLIKRL